LKLGDSELLVKVDEKTQKLLEENATTRRRSLEAQVSGDACAL